MQRIDLNCDLGEWKTSGGLDKDAQIMPFISSCNIACGGHIGNEYSIRKTIELAMKHEVGIGAHPSYPDPENFGRVVMDIHLSELEKALKTQLEGFGSILNKMGGTLHHVKPHGALYNHAAKDSSTAHCIVKVIKELDLSIPIYAQEGSVISGIAKEQGIDVCNEVFADRSYEEDLSLRSRTLKGAVIHDKQLVLKQIGEMVLERKVTTYTGKSMPVNAETICLHSDTEGSILLAKSIYEFLRSKDVEVGIA